MAGNEYQVYLETKVLQCPLPMAGVARGQPPAHKKVKLILCFLCLLKQKCNDNLIQGIFSA